MKISNCLFLIFLFINKLYNETYDVVRKKDDAYRVYSFIDCAIIRDLYLVREQEIKQARIKWRCSTNNNSYISN